VLEPIHLLSNSIQGAKYFPCIEIEGFYQVLHHLQADVPQKLIFTDLVEYLPLIESGTSHGESDSLV